MVTLCLFQRVLQHCLFNHAHAHVMQPQLYPPGQLSTIYMLMHLKVKIVNRKGYFPICISRFCLVGIPPPLYLFIALFIFSSHFSFRSPEQGFLKEQYLSEKIDQKVSLGPSLGEQWVSNLYGVCDILRAVSKFAIDRLSIPSCLFLSITHIDK